jgi:hypothetical protein
MVRHQWLHNVIHILFIKKTFEQIFFLTTGNRPEKRQKNKQQNGVTGTHYSRIVPIWILEKILVIRIENSSPIHFICLKINAKWLSTLLSDENLQLPVI